MTGEATVSAPGKTILFGEHAAVYGHAALVAALDHRLTVTARATGSLPAGCLFLDIPALGIARMVPEIRDVHAVRAPGDLAILAVAAAVPDLAHRPVGLGLRIESSIPSGSGFGSSAAVSVAIVAACRKALAEATSLEEIARLASSVERFQHEQPSGVDVSAVLRGGLLWYRRSSASDIACEPLTAGPAWLDSFRVFDSGRPNETTGEMVASVRQLRDRDPVRVRDAFAALDASTRDGRASLLRGDTAALVPIVRAAEAALETLGVVPEPVREAVRAIEARGGAAKVSGAGGASGRGAGLVLVVHPDATWHRDFEPTPGWVAHRVSLGAPGLRAESLS